jgi:hypothetical protein
MVYVLWLMVDVLWLMAWELWDNVYCLKVQELGFKVEKHTHNEQRQRQRGLPHWRLHWTKL